MALRVLLAVLALVASGCGPVLYTSHLRSAEQKLDQARDENARWYAPYEYYFAEAHLDQAREEAAQAQYEDAVRYADVAEQWSERALAITQRSRQADR
ncbi:MAG: DUF4398 domain-containing protein [Polyangiales bacterium]